MSDCTAPRKRCTKCGVEHPATVEYFYKSATGRDGLQSFCKSCISLTNGHTLRIKESLPQGMKRCAKCLRVLPETSEYFDQPKKSGGFTGHCRSCEAEWRSEYRKTHKSKLRVDRQRYRQSHNREINVYKRAYRKINPDKVRQEKILRNQRHRARSRSLPYGFKIGNWRHCLDYWHYRCAYCGRSQGLFRNMRLSADHFIPLSDPKSPGTVPENILPCCISCNSSKNDQNPFEWTVSKFGTRKAKPILNNIRVYFLSLTK